MSSATKTTDTIRYMLAANLAFMLDRRLRDAVTPGPGAFDPVRFAREGGTLYLIAESRDERPAPVAGVFAALVTEIYHQAALAAAQMPGGRLDPPMLWALDEVTQTCPVPGLPSLLADAGGRGVQIMPVVHGPAQLRTRWGKDGARAILDTCGVKVFLPGLSDPETLEMASKLAGTMAARERGAEHDTRHPIMTEDMIRGLPVRRDGTGYAFILRNGLLPVIGRPPVIWHTRRYNKLTRLQARTERALAQVVIPDTIPADEAWDVIGQGTAGATTPMPVLTRQPASPAGRAWQAGNGQPALLRPRGTRPPRKARPWDRIGGPS
jgi:hypothetical protein